MSKFIEYLPVLILIPAFILTAFTACSDQTKTSQTTPVDNSSTSTTTTTSITGATSSIETGYHIKFFQNGQQVASLGLEELHSLPEMTLNIPGSGSTEQGPTLSSVLELAGITDFSKITVTGMLKGRIATAELTLDRTEITEEVMFDFNNQGKTKLCGARIPDSNWIIDVAEIYAE